MKIPNRQELQEIAINHLSDTGFGKFKRIYTICTAESYSLLVVDSTFPSGG